MSIFAWIIAGVIAGWIAHNVAELNHGPPCELGRRYDWAFIGGLLFSSLFDIRYTEALNMLSIVAATFGAVIFLAIFRSFHTRGPDT